MVVASLHCRRMEAIEARQPLKDRAPLPSAVSQQPTDLHSHTITFCQHPQSSPTPNTTWAGAQQPAGNTGELLHAPQTPAEENREGDSHSSTAMELSLLEGSHITPHGRDGHSPAWAAPPWVWLSGTGKTSLIAFPLVLTSFQQQ